MSRQPNPQKAGEWFREGELGVMVRRVKGSLWGDENVLRFKAVKAAQL